MTRAVAAAVVLALALSGCGAGNGAPAAAGNEAAARADAATLLGKLRLPPRARRSSGEPSGDGSVLAHPAQSMATPALVDDHAWWRVRGNPRAVLAYVDGHRPAGARRILTGRGSGGGRPTDRVEGFAWPPVRDVLATRWLVLDAVDLGGGWTGLRADAEVVWIVPRAPGGRIPDSARWLRVTVGSGPKLLQGPFVVSSRRRIRRVAALLDGLPAAQPGSSSCPGAMGEQIRLEFLARTRGAPLAVAVVDTGGCGGVRLAIRGRPAQTLELGSGHLVHRLSSALGVTLAAAPGPRP